MKRILFILSLITINLSFLTLFTSCEESEDLGDFHNWQARNTTYLDSIANLANAGKDGWEKVCAWNLNDSVENIKNNILHYIYVQKMEAGTGTYRPQQNDSVRVHYMGRLMPSDNYPEGYVFDKSYSTYTLNESTDVPTLFAVKSTVVGFSTAVMNMVEGDRWKVVIPYYLGYGKTDSSSSIPSWSTLIFDIKLARVYKFQIDTNSSWH